MSAIISIPFDEVGNFSEAFKNELLAYISNSFADASETSNRGVAIAAATLDDAQARAFLNNCSNSTVTILEEIVSRDGDFLMSDVSKLTGKSNKQLRGSWGGITKRTRTICGDSEAYLIEWFKTGDGDWHGRVSPTTVSSLRVALEERN